MDLNTPGIERSITEVLNVISNLCLLLDAIVIRRFEFQCHHDVIRGEKSMKYTGSLEMGFLKDVLIIKRG